MDIDEGNKLIHLFMGNEVVPKEFHTFFKPTREYFDTKGVHLSIKELKYNYSWDWLMPVYIKIVNERLFDKGRKGKSGDGWRIYNAMYQCLGLGEGIKKLHSLIVEFIEWYNKK